ncbi:magnesium-translocating P-type ATPase [candidate division TA06 bacterium SM23_40]|uniref:Magnesium-transporting ATPase, P-type 1 n=1 Tax=candidate division TA06 bacterium SM23_40 TaxID=1703774 RepID=A0A0S8GBQ7_UNCT6|nr:MAG: magnesium-translocating P-type ATPase [candidate division TA06 bacterium SM23_40]
MVREIPTDYWAEPAANLLSALGSAPEGLSSAEGSLRLAQFGSNRLETRTEGGPFRTFLAKFKDPIVLILLFATLVSAGTGEWIDAAIILAIVLGSATLSFFQEYNAGNAAARLREQISLKATVLRDGQSRTLAADEVVPGDVVVLSAGTLIPADGVLLEATDFYVNQAVLTGETFPVEKTPGVAVQTAGLPERTNCVFKGTSVRSGTAKALIVRTGAATAFGQVAKRLTVRPPETEFERGIRRLGYLLTWVMFILVLAVFAINVFFHKSVLDSLLFSVALAVGLTPQMLPAIISILLSKGSQHMAASGVIVRRAESIENFGSMDVLCTDKTGTLTVGVVRLDGALDVQGHPSTEVYRGAYLNAHFETGLANPLDEAVLAAGEPDISGFAKVGEVPYDFVRKRLSIVVRHGEGAPMLLTKGAVENVLAVCASVQNGDAPEPLDDAGREAIRRRYAEWSRQGFRVLGVAMRDVPEQSRYTRSDEQEMSFRGFLLFFDPPKPGVKDAIADMADRGVTLKIITGDNHHVALHVAEAVGFRVTRVLTGAEMASMSDEALWHSVDRANLFTEVDPNEKERIILALKKSGHVVGYMGDGINDAPALHAADVGISVDTAVDVAREAADFVLLRQDLGVLREGIETGRATFANTLKYVFTTISANFGNMFSMAGASLFLPFLPMLPLQILLINFLTDFPSLNIAGDSVDRELVDRPRRWDIALIRRFMVTFGLTSSLFDYLTIGLLILLFKVGEQQFHTSWLLVSVLTELFVILIIRTQKPFYRSRPGRMLLATTLIVAVVTLMLPYLPFNRLLGLVPLPLPILLALAGVTALYLVVSEVVKHFFYRRDYVHH